MHVILMASGDMRDEHNAMISRGQSRWKFTLLSTVQEDLCAPGVVVLAALVGALADLLVALRAGEEAPRLRAATASACHLAARPVCTAHQPSAPPPFTDAKHS